MVRPAAGPSAMATAIARLASVTGLGSYFSSSLYRTAVHEHPDPGHGLHRGGVLPQHGLGGGRARLGQRIGGSVQQQQVLHNLVPSPPAGPASPSSRTSGSRQD